MIRKTLQGLASILREPSPPSASRLGATVTRIPANSPALGRMVEVARLRDENKDLIYGLMRETMIRAEILSSYYRFQVLTLDPEGLVQKVIVDLAPRYAGNPELLVRLEGLIARKAASLVGMRVAGIYWRNDPALDGDAPTDPQAPVAGDKAGFAILSSDAASRTSTGFEETHPVQDHDGLAPTPTLSVGPMMGPIAEHAMS